jgi:signal transduction histidine kinase
MSGTLRKRDDQSMTPLAQFLELNRNIIQFFYGMVFFSLGLTTVLQSRSYSRLELARSLKWLAAFGLVHGLYEWGELLIPLQSPNLSVESIFFWTGVQLLVLATSFTALFQFGISLLPKDRNQGWFYAIPAVILTIWIIVVFGFLLLTLPDRETWRNTGNALARYFISLPAGLLSGFALRYYARKKIAELNAPHITRSLHMVSYVLFVYALLSGLVPPPAPFFPANWFNTQAFVHMIQIPVRIFRSIVGLMLAVSVIRGLEVFDLEYARRLEDMEQKQILAIERERLARELHDGALQSVYTAGLLVESAARLATPGSPVADRLNSAISALDGAVQDMRRNLSEMTVALENQPLTKTLEQFIQEMQIVGGVQIRLISELPEDCTLSAARLAHILAIVRDALVNVFRHAHASQVDISLAPTDHLIFISIRDNGRGMLADAKPGYGLRNMSDRARLLGGKLNISNQPGKGVTLHLYFPWEEES